MRKPGFPQFLMLFYVKAGRHSGTRSARFPVLAGQPSLDFPLPGPLRLKSAGSAPPFPEGPEEEG
jgi:hypothetical protein